MRESAIEAHVVLFARMQGWLQYKFVSPSQRGVPDRLFLKDGKVIFIEFKQTGGRLSPLQRKQIDLIMAAGFDVHVIDDVELGEALFR